MLKSIAGSDPCEYSIEDVTFVFSAGGTDTHLRQNYEQAGHPQKGRFASHVGPRQQHDVVLVGEMDIVGHEAAVLERGVPALQNLDAI